MDEKPTKENPHDGHRERMREKFIADSESFFPHEVIEIILYGANKRKNTNGIAHALIDKFGSLSAVFDAPVEELMKVDGVGKQNAVLLKTYPAAFRRYQADKLENKKKLRFFGDALDYCKALLESSVKEEFVVICLDSDGSILSVKKWKGTLNKVNVPLREVVEFCVIAQATAVVIAHSHPNGSVNPSNDDIIFTKALYTALRGIDVVLTEHLIIGKDDYYSFSRDGYISKFYEKYNAEYNPLGVGKDISQVLEIFKKDR